MNCKSEIFGYLGCGEDDISKDDVCKVCDGSKAGVGVTKKCFGAAVTYGDSDPNMWMSAPSCDTEEEPEPETVSLECKSEVFTYLGCGENDTGDDVCKICDGYKGGVGITKDCFKATGEYVESVGMVGFDTVVEKCEFTDERPNLKKISVVCKSALARYTGCTCKGLAKEQCSNEQGCAFGESKKVESRACFAKDAASEQDCVQHKKRKACKNTNNCQFKEGKCTHMCAGKLRKRCLRTVARDPQMPICMFGKKKDPCFNKCCLAKE